MCLSFYKTVMLNFNTPTKKKKKLKKTHFIVVLCLNLYPPPLYLFFFISRSLYLPRTLSVHLCLSLSSSLRIPPSLFLRDCHLESHTRQNYTPVICLDTRYSQPHCPHPTFLQPRTAVSSQWTSCS